MRYIRTHHLSETSKINSACSGRERKREIDTSSLSSCSFWETLTYKYCSSRGLDHLLSPHSKPSPQIPAETCISMSAASSQQSLMVHMLLTPISWIHLPSQWEATFREISSPQPPQYSPISHSDDQNDVWDTYSSQERDRYGKCFYVQFVYLNCGAESL